MTFAYLLLLKCTTVSWPTTLIAFYQESSFSLGIFSIIINFFRYIYPPSPLGLPSSPNLAPSREKNSPPLTLHPFIATKVFYALVTSISLLALHLNSLKSYILMP